VCLHPQNGLAEAEFTIPILNDHLAALAAVGFNDLETDGLAVFSGTPEMYGAAVEVRIIHVTALGMPGGIGAYSWCGDECTERFR
jgi:hypothetical protein